MNHTEWLQILFLQTERNSIKELAFNVSANKTHLNISKFMVSPQLCILVFKALRNLKTVNNRCYLQKYYFSSVILSPVFITSYFQSFQMLTEDLISPNRNPFPSLFLTHTNHVVQTSVCNCWSFLSFLVIQTFHSSRSSRINVLVSHLQNKNIKWLHVVIKMV